MCPPEITGVTFYPIRPTAKGLIGFANCLFNHQLSLNSIAVYTRPAGSGIRLVFPQRELPNGRRVHLFHPVTRDVTDLLTEAVAAKLQEVTKHAVEARHLPPLEVAAPFQERNRQGEERVTAPKSEGGAG